MKSCEVEQSLSQMADYLHAENDSHRLASDGRVSRLGRASIALVNEVCAKISSENARNEARAIELLEKLDVQEECTRKLEDRIRHSNRIAFEAELGLTCVMDALKA